MKWTYMFCPDCTYRLRVRKDGKFPKHARCNSKVPRNQRNNVCAGSLKIAHSPEPATGGAK